jgi:hypothetical protein
LQTYSELGDRDENPCFYVITLPSAFYRLFALCIYKIVLLERPNKDLLKNGHKEGFPAHRRMD